MTGLVALTAVTAGAVIAFGSSSDDGDAVAAAKNPAPVSASAAGGAEPSGSASPSSPASGTHAPSASPAAKKPAGHVAHGVHSGDLRYFLIPPPAGADVYGDTAGSADSAADVVAGSADEGQAKQALTTYGFRGAATRTYLTADGVSEVTVELVRFRGPSQAAGYYSTFYYQAGKVALHGSHPARGYDLSSASAESTDTLLAISYQGDVDITISVTGGKTPSHALLQHLLDAQYQRLKTGH